MDRLKGKVAMVVGAGSIGPGWGNGKATAVTFAREGAQVFCVDRNPAAAEETVKIITGEGGKAIAHTADVSRASEVEAMVTACMKAHGRIDVLDNNVGIAEVGSVVEVDETSWDRVFAVNLKSAYLSMKHVIPIMVKQGGGSIINISSIASIRHIGISYISYNASKAAMNQMTKSTGIASLYQPLCLTVSCRMTVTGREDQVNTNEHLEVSREHAISRTFPPSRLLQTGCASRGHGPAIERLVRHHRIGNALASS